MFFFLPRFCLSFFIALFIFLWGVSSSYAAMQDYPIVKLQALDKSTARTVTFEAKVGTTIEYGSLFIKIQACRKSNPLEKPESASFLQIWEVPINAEKSEWIFSGWMFASSPALSAMDHSVYDVWILDCLNKNKQNSKAKKSETKQRTADQGELEPVKEESKKEVPKKKPAKVSKESDNSISKKKKSQTGGYSEDSIESVINRAKSNE